ncbi:MAG: hypothetical protein R2865_02640 [Deinococcales bacterium]
MLQFKLGSLQPQRLKFRIVFDLDETFALEAFRSQGILKAQEPVSWQLPAMLLPLYLPLEFENFKASVREQAGHNQLQPTSQQHSPQL